MFKRFCLALCLAFVFACSEKSSDPDPVIQHNLSQSQLSAINQAIEEISDSRAQGLIVQQSEQQSASNTQNFSFTNGSQMSIPLGLIDELVLNRDTWQAELSFLDGQTTFLYLLGTSIGIQTSDITLNPFGNSPLAALAEFTTPVPGSISLEVQEKTAGVAIGNTFSQTGLSFSLPVLGLYQDYNNQVEFQLFDLEGNFLARQTINIQTSAVNTPLNINIVRNELSATDNSVYMIADNQMAFDQYGELRWLIDDPNILYVFRKLSNGNMTAANSETLVIYHFGAFSEITMLGEIVERYNVANLVHHEARLDTNKNTYFIAGNSYPVISPSSFMDGLPEEDIVMEIDRQSGAIIKRWDFNEILDPNRSGMHDLASRPEDWAHINAVYYDEQDNSIVVSLRSQSTVAKVDYQTGNIKWLLSAHGLWSEDYTQYLLSPVDSQGAPLDINTAGFWPSAQHAPLKLANGDIVLYDNGNVRGLYTQEDSTELYSRMAQYRIDEQDMTIQLIDVFPEHQDWYTPATGDVDYLAETQGKLISFLWGSANTPRVIELNTEGEPIFEFSINLGSNYYRAEKFSLYEGIQ